MTLIIGAIVGSSIAASAASQSKPKTWSFDLRTTDYPRAGGVTAGRITWTPRKKLPNKKRCYNAKIAATVTDINDSDKHGAIGKFEYFDCASGRNKTITVKTTPRTRYVTLNRSLSNVRDIRVTSCLYQGKDMNRFCNLKGAL